MKNFKPIAICLILLSSLFMGACDWAYTSDTNTITIDGYGEDWTLLVGDDSRRHFKEAHVRFQLPVLFSSEKTPGVSV
jgi:hypothetical protein